MVVPAYTYGVVLTCAYGVTAHAYGVVLISAYGVVLIYAYVGPVWQVDVGKCCGVG